MKYFTLTCVAMTVFGATSAMAAVPKVVVLELFTSQSCSSCPAADELLKRLSAEDASLLPLSFHVDYWDHLNWKDPFSSAVNTDRQKIYSRRHDESGIYTPQLVVNGQKSAVGSRRDDVLQAIGESKAEPEKAHVVIEQDKNAPQYNVHISGTDIKGAEILVVRYNRTATTEVKAGENGGRTLNNINNVLSIKSLGEIVDNRAAYNVALAKDASEGIAILVQQPQQGAVLGAAYF